MFTVTKSYRDLPAAHRQPKHDGHCRWIHGHNWGFDLTLGCTELDENGFVVDVGKLKPVKSWLEHIFDHTLLINQDDPELHRWRELHEQKLIDLRVVPNCGMEALAQYVCEGINLLFAAGQCGDGPALRGVHVVSIVCLEDSKNVATYKPGDITSPTHEIEA